LLLPMRKTVDTIDLPDMTLTLTPGIIDVPTAPPPVITPPITPVPPVTAPPPDTGSNQFAVINIHDRLPWAPENNDYRGTAPKHSLTIHWEGPDAIPLMDNEHTIQYLIGVAIGHIARDWGGGQRGGGIMYHECIAQSGDSLIMRDYTEIAWHAGLDAANLDSRAILVMCSSATGPTPAQLRAVIKRWIDFGKPAIWPHRHWSATACPGDQLTALVDQLRVAGGF
jgi:hypothetical protein